MDFNMYLYEKTCEAHDQDLRREMAERRRLSRLPRHRRSMSRRIAYKLGMLLLKLGTWLKQFEQSHTPLEDHV
jgi:hypothetical protein